MSEEEKSKEDAEWPITVQFRITKKEFDAQESFEAVKNLIQSRGKNAIASLENVLEAEYKRLR